MSLKNTEKNKKQYGASLDSLHKGANGSKEKNSSIEETPDKDGTDNVSDHNKTKNSNLTKGSLRRKKDNSSTLNRKTSFELQKEIASVTRPWVSRMPQYGTER